MVLLLRYFAADIYDVVIVWMTAKWYAAVFDKLKSGDRIFDVGIGTATALVRNKEALLKKRLSVVGIDYEAAYVQKAQAVLKKAGLGGAVPEGTEGYRPGEHYCRVLEGSIYDSGLSVMCTTDAGTEVGKGFGDNPVPEELRFDAAYFSGSLTLMPDPPGALRAVVPLEKQNGGRVFITQTFQKRPSSFMSVMKPLLRHVTTIDFGQLTTEEDLKRIIEGVDCLEVLENAPIEGSLDTHLQTARLIVLRPKGG
jgi:ubiquinone/menaquinone biosynthesis C-methylase UbiE